MSKTATEAIDRKMTRGATVTVTEVVEAEIVEKLEPIQVTGVLQFVIPTPNESMHMMHKSLVGIQQTLDTQTQIMDAIHNEQSLDVLYGIQKMLNKRMNNKVLPDPNYVKTKDAASYIAVDPSFLTKGQGTTFKEGIHYFRPEGSTILRWDLKMLEKWLRTAKDEEDYNEILDQMFS